MAILIGNGGSGTNEGPIANGWDDLLTKLKAFLLANNWTSPKDETIGTGDDQERFVYLQGPNIDVSGTTVNTHVNIRRFQNTLADIYNWEIQGAIAFNTNEPFNNQPGINPRSDIAGPTYTLDNATTNPNIPYWFIVNNRRFIVIAQVQTVFASMHGGFILPYAIPSEYRFPLYIGVTTGLFNIRFSLGSFNIGAFHDPGRGGQSSLGAAYILHYDQSWREVRNYTDNAGLRNRATGDTGIWPYKNNNSSSSIGVNTDVWINNLDSSTYTLFPLIITSSSTGGNVYGEIEGVFYVTGFGLSSGNTISINNIDYLVIQTMDRTNEEDYFAVRLQ